MRSNTLANQRRLDPARARTDELAALITRRLPEDGAIEAAPGLFLSRFSRPTGPLHVLVEPSFCAVAQGSKVMLLGQERYRYDPSTYLLVSAGVPLIAHVVDAS